MDSIGNQVRTLFMKLSRKEKLFFGGPPFSEEVEREVANYNKYQSDGLPNRKRICLGVYAYDDEQRIIGYQASTIMQCSNPTAYEREHLGLESSLNYVQLKKILVDPEYFGKGISNRLLEFSLELAYKHNKYWVADVNISNDRMINFLAKYNISKRYEWKTPRDTTMNRFGI